MSVNKLIQVHKAWEAQMDSCIKNYKKTAASKFTVTYVENKLTTLNRCWQEIFDNHHLILVEAAGNEADKTIPYLEDEVYDEAEEKFHTARALMETKLIELRPLIERQAGPIQGDIPVQFMQPHQESHIRLPNIPLPKFSGEYSEWSAYRDQFMAMIHNNERLAAVEKMQYLKVSVVGDAASLLKHIQVTAANYAPAWASLNERYDNKRSLINVQLKNLLSQSNVSESANGIKKLLDTTNECLQQLMNLGIDLSSWDCILIYITVQKLPIETHQLWEQTLSDSSELPMFKDLNKFLTARFRTLEVIGQSKSRPSTMQQHNSKEKHSSKQVYSQSVNSHSKDKCPVCSCSHQIRQCPNFNQLNQERKLEIVRKNGLCINCLGLGHIVARCPSTRTCFHCRKRHHSLLHIGSNKLRDQTNIETNHAHIEQIETTESALETQEPINALHAGKIGNGGRILLATALVTLISTNGVRTTVRALLDQGSEACFITEAVVQRLNLKRDSVNADVVGLGRSEAGNAKSKVHVTMLTKDTEQRSIDIHALVFKSLTNLLPSQTIPVLKWNHLQNLDLADPKYFEPSKIDLLLGADVYAQIIQAGLRKGPVGAPTAQRTMLGWILSGEIIENPQYGVSNTKKRTILTLHNQIELNEQLKQFWELEEITPKRRLTRDEQQCEEYFKRTVKRELNGRYVVRLPFKDIETNGIFGRSRDLAIRRLIHLEKRFERDPKLKIEYAKTVNEYLTLGHMIPSTSDENQNSIHGLASTLYKCNYMPHHAVIKESSTTTRLRVVFDASQKTSNGKSLNESLLTGPTIQEDLMALVLRWRKHKIVFTADIQKMYRQIQVSDEDTNYQRIVWRNHSSEPIVDYNLKTVTFGTSSAPFLAIRTLQQLAIDERDTYAIGSEVALSDFYVDDVISGADTIELALTKQSELIRLLKTGCFDLRKWSSNQIELLEHLPSDHVELNLPLNLNRDNGIKTLGIQWDPVTDQFGYRINLETIQSGFTKRSILSDIAKIFDPMGWITPTTIIAKIKIQALWLSGKAWDEQLSNAYIQDWKEYRENLWQLQQLKIPRWIYTKSGNAIQLHGFSDASIQAYAASIYIRCSDEQGIVRVNLLTAKSKVAPLKSISLPRLELCGALLLAKLIRKTIAAMNFESIETFAWTDSTIVLSWIRGHPNKWTTFVANRVAEIQEITNIDIWNHVPSTENPADCATRGVLPSDIQAHPIWWTGPQWLRQSKQCWPSKKIVESTELESKRVVSVNSTLVVDDVNNLLSRYSTLRKLIAVTGFCFRFCKNCKEPASKIVNEWLTVKEQTRALEFWIKYVQQLNFTKEISNLKENMDLQKNSRIINLSPFLDNDGFLRVGGRLKHSNLSYNEKHPIILPNKSDLTNLLIDEVHKHTLHGGVQLMMATLQRKYWIIDSRNSIRHRTHKCTTCFRQRAEAAQQKMGDLPAARINIARPFSNSGVDYAGPINIKTSKGRSPKTTKAYIAIFVCLAVKAVHIELVSDMTTESFLAAFRRFAARRGTIENMYSDNGTTFVGASKEINLQFKHHWMSMTQEVRSLLAYEGLTWHFIPPAAPHFGGLWEANVKSMKGHLKRVVGNSTLTYEEMSTTLSQIEACLNSRPLCPITHDPNDFTALTPGHFLTGNAILTPPEPCLLDSNVHRLNRWQYIQYLQQQFWQRWSKEYLVRLQQRPKWMCRQENIKIGSLVLLKDEKVPPTRWLLARVTDIHLGKDGLARVINLCTKNGFITRPITKICPLPIDDPILHDLSQRPIQTRNSNKVILSNT